ITNYVSEECDKNEEYSDCVDPCLATCQTPAPPSDCDSTNCLAGCQCIQGYVRINQGEKCVPITVEKIKNITLVGLRVLTPVSTEIQFVPIIAWQDVSVKKALL
ncbi:TIL domain containing protein, partial [Asbolus verrucosus]